MLFLRERELPQTAAICSIRSETHPLLAENETSQVPLQSARLRADQDYILVAHVVNSPLGSQRYNGPSRSLRPPSGTEGPRQPGILRPRDARSGPSQGN